MILKRLEGVVAAVRINDFHQSIVTIRTYPNGEFDVDWDMIGSPNPDAPIPPTKTRVIVTIETQETS